MNCLILLAAIGSDAVVLSELALNPIVLPAEGK